MSLSVAFRLRHAEDDVLRLRQGDALPILFRHFITSRPGGPLLERGQWSGIGRGDVKAGHGIEHNGRAGGNPVKMSARDQGYGANGTRPELFALRSLRGYSVIRILRMMKKME